MSMEIQPSGESDDFDWFQSQLNDMPEEYTLEPDCQSLDEQITRNLYYGSGGAEIDLSDTRIMRVDTLTESIVFSPLADTSFGVLCQALNFSNSINDNEFLFVAGTLFIPSHEYIPAEKLQTKHELHWPDQNDRDALVGCFEGVPNIVLNRSVATLGHFVYRYSFSEKEMEIGVDYKNSTFYPLDVTLTDEHVRLYIPDAIELTDRVVYIAAEGRYGIKEVSI